MREPQSVRSKVLLAKHVNAYWDERRNLAKTAGHSAVHSAMTKHHWHKMRTKKIFWAKGKHGCVFED